MAVASELYTRMQSSEDSKKEGKSVEYELRGAYL